MLGLSTPARREEMANATSAQQEARARMALFPTATETGHTKSEVIFVDPAKWVPVVRLAGKVRLYSKASLTHAALRLPGHSLTVPATPVEPSALLASPTGVFQAFPPFDLYFVGLTLTSWLTVSVVLNRQSLLISQSCKLVSSPRASESALVSGYER